MVFNHFSIKPVISGHEEKFKEWKGGISAASDNFNSKIEKTIKDIEEWKRTEQTKSSQLRGKN